MCDTCGCNITTGNQSVARQAVKDTTAVTVLKNLLAKNDDQATHNRQHFDKYRLLTINLMSSPGSGKTALLEATIDALCGKYRIGVIEGDLETGQIDWEKSAQSASLSNYHWYSMSS